MFRLIVMVFSAMLVVLPCAVGMAAQDVSPEVRALIEEGWAYEKLIHIDLDNLDKAEAAFSKALSLAPESAETHWRMAEIVYKQGENRPYDKDTKDELFKKALDYATKSLELEPNNVGGLFWTGSINGKMAQLVGIFSALGKVKEARTNMLAVVEYHPDHRYANIAYAVLGAIYSSTPWPMKDMDKAVEYGETAVKNDPKLTMASVELAQVYIKLKEYDKARAELNRCLEVKEPTYIWDSVMKNWPKAKELLEEIKDK
ncbi:MAG: tetratricopeptide repeat protein [Desulfatibacillum sp.]|nr:tetratricopeptide repeat protein [Desulfatibacillum sp.]